MKRSGTYQLLLLLLFVCISFVVKAQTFKSAVDRNRILIGEQIQLTLTLEGIGNTGGSINNWVELPDTLNHLEVVERGKIDTIQVSSDVTLRQTITITSFDSGQWQLPAFKIAVGNGRIMASDPITIDVLPVDVSNLKDYHDIKDIVAVKNKYSLWILIAIAVITILSIIAVYIFIKRKARFVPQAKPLLKGNQTPIQWALSSIEELQKQQLPLKGQVKQYYQELTNICRQYFQLELKHKALQQTSDEWILNMNTLPVEPAIKTSFFQFVRLADTVKFAKYLPPSNENEQSVTIAKQMLMNVSNMQAPISSTNKTTVV